MPQEIVINTLDDIRPALDQVLAAGDEAISLEVNPEITITIILDGKTWDGLIDVRVAKFVTELQGAHDRLHKELDIPGVDKPLVKVRIKDGSTELDARLYDLFAETLRNMTSNQQFIIVIGMMLMFGAGWSLRRVLAHIKDKHAADLAREESREKTELIHALNQTVQHALEKIDGEKPLRRLVLGMEEGDKVKLPGAPVLTKDEARALYRRKPRVTPMDVMIDDNYRVEKVGMDIPYELTLSKGAVNFKAEFANGLAAENTAAFLERVKNAMEALAPLRVPLRIDARLNDKGVMQAVIVGIGQSPREHSQDLAEFFEV